MRKIITIFIEDDKTEDQTENILNKVLSFYFNDWEMSVTGKNKTINSKLNIGENEETPGEKHGK